VPGFYTVYGVKTLEQREWKEFNAQMLQLSQTIEALAAQIDKATALLPKP
jgi:hypothetical protein